MGSALETKQVIWAEYMPEGSTHKHMVYDIGPLTGEELEEMVTDLADAILVCNEERHEGHGRPHSHDEAMKGARIALFQLQNMDYDADWAEYYRKEFLFRKWGKKQVPVAHIMPDPHDPKQWWVVMPDGQGNPIILPANPDVVKDWRPPEWGKNAYRDPSGVGWVVKRRLSAQERFRRMQERGEG